MSKAVTISKISHQLEVEEDSLAFLDALSEKEIDVLFESINNKIENEDDDIWQKLAKVTHFMPAFITAKVSETVMGEMVCAKVAEHLSVKDALKVLKHLSTDFLAKVATHLNATKCEPLINAISMSTIKKVHRNLLEKEEYYTLAEFVDVLELSKVLAVVEVIGDEADLLRISHYVQQKDLIAKIVAELPDKRINKMIKKAYAIEMQEEIFLVFEVLPSSQLQRILKIVNQFSDDFRVEVIRDLDNRIKN